MLKCTIFIYSCTRTVAMYIMTICDIRFRKVALVVLLTRAGLDLDPEALKKLYLRVILLGIVPWLAEAVLMALLSHYYLCLPWLWAMLLGFVCHFTFLSFALRSVELTNVNILIIVAS